MVSHHHTGSNVSVRSEHPSRGADVTELDSVYKHNPLPSMPRFMTSGVQRQMAGDSMLAYTERMREFAKARNEALLYEDSSNSVLEVRAQHIPKWRAKKDAKKAAIPSKQRRPLSLDELIGRPENSDAKDKSQAKRRFSVPSGVSSFEMGSVPSPEITSPREKNAENRRVRISFVSAADLFDLVDFSLRSKRSRNESIKLAKAEDTLRLLTDDRFFKPGGSKTDSEEESAIDPTSLLMVKGNASPRENVDLKGPKNGLRQFLDPLSSTSVIKDGAWAKTDLSRHSSPRNSYSADSTKDEEFLDIFPDAEMLSQASHKLKTRPKRAKRMKLHRSHLSAIPEDDHHHEQSAHAPEQRDVRMPVVPTSTSLAAIKGTRSKTPSKSNESMEESSTRRHQKNCGEDNKENKDKSIPNTSLNSNTVRRALDAQTTRNEDMNYDVDRSYLSSRRYNAPRGENSVNKVTENGVRHPGSNSVVTGAKVKAQKKFRKLIFLRDYPDQSYTRYS